MADAILTTDLTTGSLDGTGVFDLLMAATKPHIKAEYDNGRIKGAEYSQVYLAALNSAMSQSIEFLLRQDATKAQNDILEQQLLQAVADTATANAQTALLTAQELLIDKDILKRTQETLTEAAQTALLTAQELLIDKDILKRTQETLTETAQTALLTAQELLIDKDILLRTQEILTEVENTAVATAAKCKLQAEFDLIVQQKLKAVQETAVLTQKVVTETAQTSGASISATSVIGSQVALYTAQKDGFTRDAEQKAAKLYFDTWNVRRTTDSTVATNTTNELTDADVGAVANKLKTGIGV